MDSDIYLQFRTIDTNYIQIPETMEKWGQQTSIDTWRNTIDEDLDFLYFRIKLIKRLTKLYHIGDLHCEKSITAGKERFNLITIFHTR